MTKRIGLTVAFSLAAILAVGFFLFGFEERPESIYMILSIAATGVLMGAVVIYSLDKTFLQPIAQLKEGVEFLRTKGGPDGCLNVTGKYELEELGRSINCLLEELADAQQELKKSEKRYRYLSFKDPLTGLYNRAFFDYEMKRINKNLEQYLPLSIISVDIDGHKIVNDTFGHTEGDRQIKYVADILANSIRRGDTLSRIGGDEFCIILPNVSQKVANQRRENIHKAVESHNSGNPFIPLSISVGVATLNSKGKRGSVYDLYHLADDDMYYHKYSKTESVKNRVIELLLSALSEKDYASHGHIKRMVKMAGEMADRLGLDEKMKNDLLLVASIHDLGKLGVPDEILFKAGKLSQNEMSKAKKHVRIGYNMAVRTNQLAHVAEYILHHHEWWDGSGYPSKMKGSEIPLICRILSVIDAYDIMTIPLPYRPAKSKEEAVEELKKCAGTQFEPAVVEKFIEMIEEGNI
jgi:diguanylate cyclase (GGDEF)-like protein